MINTVSEESGHLKNHEHYHKEVYNPYMYYICKVMYGFDNDVIVEVPEELQSVGWNDGDIMMLDAIIKKETGRQFIENYSIRCKQSVKRTQVEKMCDVANIFNLLKKIKNKKH